MNDKIKVGFYGAVNSGGKIFLTKPATIKSGLDAVGGSAKAKTMMWPAGIIRVRRKVDGRMKRIRLFHMSAKSAKWERFALKPGDAVIFQWHVAINNKV